MSVLRLSRRHVLALAAFLWLAAGVALVVRAAAWVSMDEPLRQVELVTASFVLMPFGYRFAFRRVVSLNFVRIASAPEPLGLGSVISFRGLGMIAGMMSLGILLRNSSIPRDVLVVPYAAMGGMLMTGALHLWRRRTDPLMRPTVGDLPV